MTESTAFVTLCDAGYLRKAHQTIKDLRTRGQWKGDIVLIAVDFAPPADFLMSYNVQVVSFPRFDLSSYVATLRTRPFSRPTDDGREYTKLTQWEKLHVFDPFFKRWDRIIWVDAGLRVLDSVEHVLAVPWRGRIVAPDDTAGKSHRFSAAVELTQWPEALREVQDRYNVRLEDRYFLNCFWIMDTALPVEVADFLALLEYPIWRHNEMGVMNALLHFKHGLWSTLPSATTHGKMLFAWSDVDFRKHWDKFVLIKYPVSIKFDV
jgi:hypothetical protein